MNMVCRLPACASQTLSSLQPGFALTPPCKTRQGAVVGGANSHACDVHGAQHHPYNPHAPIYICVTPVPVQPRREQAASGAFSHAHDGMAPTACAAATRMRPQIPCLTAVSARSRREQAWAVPSAMREAGVAPTACAAAIRMRPQIPCLTAIPAQSRREQAWAVLSAMREAGVAPSTRSYNALLAACDRGGQPARALEVLRRMQREVLGATRAACFGSVANASPVKRRTNIEPRPACSCPGGTVAHAAQGARCERAACLRFVANACPVQRSIHIESWLVRSVNC